MVLLADPSQEAAGVRSRTPHLPAILSPRYAGAAALRSHDAWLFGGAVAVRSSVPVFARFCATRCALADQYITTGPPLSRCMPAV